MLRELSTRHPLGYEPTLQWRAYRTTAGMAFYAGGRIALSAHLLTDRERLVSTLLHEYAHLLAFVRHGAAGKGHGRPWREAMRELNAEPEARHRYDCRRNIARQTVRYRCNLCGKRFEKRRRYPKGQSYIHLNCGGVLRYVDTVREA